MVTTTPEQPSRPVTYPGLECEVCGLPAVAFYPGRLVDHGGGLGCDVRRKEHVRLARDEDGRVRVR